MPPYQQFLTWDDNEHGAATVDTSPTVRSATNSPADISPSATSGARMIRNGNGQDEYEASWRRRSSMSARIASFRQVGGLNSLDNFARSWQRAAEFHEIGPLIGSPMADDAMADTENVEADRRPPISRSLLSQQLSSATSHDRCLEALDDGLGDNTGRRNSPRRMEDTTTYPDIFWNAAALQSPIGHSIGTSYGTISSRIQETSRKHGAQLLQKQEPADAADADKEREPLLARQITTEEGPRITEIIGQSTLPQTVFNSVNTLIGVGLLSLPLGIKYAGWLVGLTFLAACAAVTSYTAKILSVCLNVDPSLVTYADIAYVSFGGKARLATGLLFSVELIAACVALVVLFADSLDALIPGWGLVQWKILCGILLIPLNFMPLRYLSFSSILGILCCVGLVSVVIVDGLIKSHQPGSLRDPMITGLFPEHWSTLPLSFGLLMAPWGGHSVFPSIYRDMRHPQKYTKNLRYSFSFTFCIDLLMAVVGLFMFGSRIHEEVTSNILLTRGYPRPLSIMIAILITIVPITKIPLNCRPVINTVEMLCGLDLHLKPSHSCPDSMSPFARGALQALTRTCVVILIVVIAAAVPAFDIVMALMGSALCFSICVILPLAFYLKIFGQKISLGERIIDWALILCCSVMAVVGTVWAFLPKEQVEAGFG